MSDRQWPRFGFGSLIEPFDGSPATTKTTTKQLLSRKAASEYLLTTHSLAIEASSLARYAYSGTGPRYVMVGARAMYAARDLDAWAQSRIRKPDRERRIAEAEKVAAPRAA